MLAESERHYERLVEAPFVYGQTLSGNVTLDAVVADYTKRAQERTLLFDAVVEPVHISDMAELDVTVIADAMLETALHMFRQVLMRLYSYRATEKGQFVSGCRLYDRKTNPAQEGTDACRSPDQKI